MRAVFRVPTSIGLLLVGVACGGSDGGTPPADVNTIAKNAGDGQTATVGAAAPVAPSVRITNQNQAAVANVAVTFAVASGGGAITGGSTTTNASGVATVGSWTMGTVVGANTLTATAAGVNGSPLTFSVTANAGAPATITKQGGDNQTGAPTDAVTTRPSVKVVDQFGNPVAGAVVTFAIASGGGVVTGATSTTGADGIAAVGAWTLGPNAGANTLTATVTGTGVTGNPATFTATAQFAVFNPTASVAITGNRTYSSVNIPAGVTVTVNSDAVITVNGDFTQAGIINAPCHTLRIDATGLLTSSGNISNDCTDPAADGNDLVLIGRGGYNISNNELASSGDIWIMDGPTLALPTISARPRVSTRSSDVAEAGPYRCRLVGMKLLARPLTKAKGANGTPRGTDGKSGTSRTSGCGQLLSGQTGGNLLVNGLTMTGGHGAEGGDGTSANSTPSVGGAGGEPGALNLVSDGDLDIQGVVTLNLGNGGNGGNAMSTGAAGSPGVSVTATGGKGGGLKPRNFSSPVTIQAKTGTLTVTGSLTINFGTGGQGGIAIANGGRGNDGNPGAKGGDATANGGGGGDSQPFQLVAGNRVVVLGTIDVTGGAGGKGGESKPTPGGGGNGNVPGASGGDAGVDGASRGGKGGNGNPPASLGDFLPASVLVSPGGAGGTYTASGAKGGNGAPNCPNAGGAGGRGGNASGGGGDRGNGTPAGALAAVTFNSYGNGGNGAALNGPLGAGGANGTSFGSGASGTPPAPGSFLPGLPGGPCPTTSVTANFASSTPQLSPGAVTAGTYAVQLLDAATQAVVGSVKWIAAGAAFYGGSPLARLGWSSGSWTADIVATVAGAPWTFTEWEQCLINAQSPISVTIEELDVNLNVLAFRTLTPVPTVGDDGVAGRIVTAQGCLRFTLNVLTRFVRTRGSGGDLNGVKGVGAAVVVGFRK